MAQIKPTMMRINHLKVCKRIKLKSKIKFLTSDRAISTDPCRATKEITKMISKWSDRFMADCKSHQRNPQIPKKMEKFKNKMLDHLRSQAGYVM